MVATLQSRTPGRRSRLHRRLDGMPMPSVPQWRRLLRTLPWPESVSPRWVWHEGWVSRNDPAVDWDARTREFGTRVVAWLAWAGLGLIGAWGLWRTTDLHLMSLVNWMMVGWMGMTLWNTIDVMQHPPKALRTKVWHLLGVVVTWAVVMILVAVLVTSAHSWNVASMSTSAVWLIVGGCSLWGMTNAVADSGRWMWWHRHRLSGTLRAGHLIEWVLVPCPDTDQEPFLWWGLIEDADGQRQVVASAVAGLPPAIGPRVPWGMTHLPADVVVGQVYHPAIPTDLSWMSHPSTPLMLSWSASYRTPVRMS